MADERSSVAYFESDAAVDEIELIDDLEPIEDSEEAESAVLDAASTGAHPRPAGSVAESSAPPPARISSPPPVPPEARQSRPPEARGSVPPASRQRSQSGMFRIEHPSWPPPVQRHTIPPDTSALPSSESDALREAHAYAQRLRLMLRLREDRINELEAALREQRERAERFARELSQVSTQPLPDDLKRISGIGPGFERALIAAGVSTFEQIAQWSSDDVERIAALIRTVPQRIVRGRWVERAQEIVAERAG